MSQRTDRLDSQLQQELMGLMQREMKDPRIGFATITRVETARDLGHARVWVSVYGTDAERERSLAALRDAAPWLRRRLGDLLTLRHVPELTIRLDESIASGDRVLRILHELDASEGD
ncbi:MAG TPA: 30S ribosome-binding factor RbfA [Candidatus Saccharimonadales bacterium]|jgi:ribosome-binding factor A|nr:30S ribosome-binding factor RbfA [Candidatus Saccharimonadales bacterium]